MPTYTFILIPAVWAAAVVLCGCSDSSRPGTFLDKCELAPCPDSPNCISSKETNPSRRIEPLHVPMPPEDAMARLLQILEQMKRVRIVTFGDRYVHAEFISRFFSFVDDVEFVLDEQHMLLHMRSASRVGYYDFGANRRRLESMAERLRGAGFQ